MQVTRDGEDLPVRVDDLPAYYGSVYALSFVPNGWSAEPGTYDIEITGTSVPIAYTVTLVDCAR